MVTKEKWNLSFGDSGSYTRAWGDLKSDGTGIIEFGNWAYKEDVSDNGYTGSKKNWLKNAYDEWADEDADDHFDNLNLSFDVKLGAKKYDGNDGFKFKWSKVRN